MDKTDQTIKLKEGRSLGFSESPEKILASPHHHNPASVRGPDRADQRQRHRAVYLYTVLNCKFHAKSYLRHISVLP